MGYEREELVTIGEQYNTESLLDWSTQINATARVDLPRLKKRGITEQTLRDIEAGRGEVSRLNIGQEGEKKDVSTLPFGRQKAMDGAFDWREEAKGLAVAIFDSEPAVLARFRTGVKVSHSIPKLIAETEFLEKTVREHLPALSAVGADDAFVARGEEALRGLREAQGKQGEERAQTPGATTELHYAQGILYTRVRFVVRIARVEFRKEEGKLGRYSYAALRRQEAAAEGLRAQAARRAVPASGLTAR